MKNSKRRLRRRIERAQNATRKKQDEIAELNIALSKQRKKSFSGYKKYINDVDILIEGTNLEEIARIKGEREKSKQFVENVKFGIEK